MPDTDPLAVDQQLYFVLSVATRNVAATYRPVLATVNLTPTHSSNASDRASNVIWVLR